MSCEKGSVAFTAAQSHAEQRSRASIEHVKAHPLYLGVSRASEDKILLGRRDNLCRAGKCGKGVVEHVFIGVGSIRYLWR